MALTATIYNFDVQLSDTDRNVYETLALRLACQPSETAEYLLTRALAYCLEYQEGIAFSRGLAEPESPALAVRDLTGVLTSWIDVGPRAVIVGAATDRQRRERAQLRQHLGLPDVARVDDRVGAAERGDRFGPDEPVRVRDDPDTGHESLHWSASPPTTAETTQNR